MNSIFNWVVRQWNQIELSKSRHDYVRRYAAKQLGLLGDPRSVESLIAALQDSVWEVRDAAASALGRLGDSRAVEPLIAALQDSHWGVRRAAAAALGQAGDPLAIQPLTSALLDADEDLQLQAANALRSLNWKHSDATLRVIKAIDTKDRNACLHEGAIALRPLIGLGIAAYKGAIPLPEGLRKNLPGAQQEQQDAAKGLKPRAR